MFGVCAQAFYARHRPQIRRADARRESAAQHTAALRHARRRRKDSCAAMSRYRAIAAQRIARHLIASPGARRAFDSYVRAANMRAGKDNASPAVRSAQPTVQPRFTQQRAAPCQQDVTRSNVARKTITARLIKQQTCVSAPGAPATSSFCRPTKRAYRVAPARRRAPMSSCPRRRCRGATRRDVTPPPSPRPFDLLDATHFAADVYRTPAIAHARTMRVAMMPRRVRRARRPRRRCRVSASVRSRVRVLTLRTAPYRRTKPDSSCQRARHNVREPCHMPDARAVPTRRRGCGAAGDVAYEDSVNTHQRTTALQRRCRCALSGAPRQCQRIRFACARASCTATRARSTRCCPPARSAQRHATARRVTIFTPRAAAPCAARAAQRNAATPAAAARYKHTARRYHRVVRAANHRRRAMPRVMFAPCASLPRTRPSPKHV